MEPIELMSMEPIELMSVEPIAYNCGLGSETVCYGWKSFVWMAAAFIIIIMTTQRQ